MFARGKTGPGTQVIFYGFIKTHSAMNRLAVLECYIVMTTVNKTNDRRTLERKSKDRLIELLNEAVRDDTIAKAAFLAEFDDPEQAFIPAEGGLSRLKKNGFGVAAAFENKNEMDKASVEVALSAAGYEPLLAYDTASVQKACGRQLTSYPEHHSAELYEDAIIHFRESYAKVMAADKELVIKQSEMQRCSAALRCLYQEDSLLNKENKMRVSVIQSKEKEAISHRDAKRKAEEKISAIDEQLTDANVKLPKELAELEETEKKAAVLEQEIAELEKKTTFFGSLFRKDRNILKADLETKRTELDSLKKKREESLEDTQKLKLEIERLEEHARTHKSEAARMDSQFARAKDDLIKAREDYSEGEKRFALSQDRIKETKRKLSALEESCQLAQEADRIARNDALTSARRVLMAFLVSSKTYRSNLRKIANLKPEEIPEAAFETVMFMTSVLFLDWSAAAEHLEKESGWKAACLIGYGTDPDTDLFEKTVAMI